MPKTARANLLIVEDDAHFRETLVDALSLKKVEARGVGTGVEALKLLESFTPSLILMDVQLPDMHGFDLCRRLRKSVKFKGVPIVLLSARYTEPADRAEGLLTGAEAYMAKPVNVDSLWKEVNYLLDKKE